MKKVKEESFPVRIPYEEMQLIFYEILLKHRFKKSKALECAKVFATNSLEGVYTHGVNRFAKFVQYIKDGVVNVGSFPSLKNNFGGVEQWDGNLGAGISNAIYATKRSMTMAKQNGIGCVALSNTNHWMRGGYYGRIAAKKKFVFIGWTNTIANMPAWNAIDNRLGNNPLVIALPFEDDVICLDMAMSQFSFGSLELKAMKNEKLNVFGGYDAKGNLTEYPRKIIESKRPLPIGYWKGSGLSLLLDMLATILSGGLSTHDISKQKFEASVSQIFICIDLKKLQNNSLIASAVNNIINDYLQSSPVNKKEKIIYPGERTAEIRKQNLKGGIPVLKKVWDEILEL